MRSYVNTMLFEGALDTFTDTNLAESVTAIFAPRVQIIEGACDTLLAERLKSNLDLLGRIELATGLAINSTRLTAIAGTGEEYIPVRSAYTCISNGGICKACYAASRPLAAIPNLNDFVVMAPEFIIQREHIVVVPGTTTMTLSYDTTQYDTAYVFTDGTLRLQVEYTISGTTLTIPSGVPPDDAGDMGTVTVWYATVTRAPFIYWLATTYSGSLMGMSPLPTRPFQVRKSLFTSLIPRGDVELLSTKVVNSTLIPDAIREYLPTIADYAEKTVLATMVNAIYFQ